MFAGYNYQFREFTDFDEFESQNWLMTSLSKSVQRRIERPASSACSRSSHSRFADIGSPQVFQTGETFEGAPLIDYQHPHDLIMNLGGEYSLGFGATTVTIGAYAVGPAPLGPPVFMHRPSAIENPQAPLSHHYLDSTHITPGVISLGVDTLGLRHRGRRVSRPGAGRGSSRSRHRRARFVQRARVMGGRAVAVPDLLARPEDARAQRRRTMRRA